MKKTLIAVGAGLSVPVVFGGALMVWAATSHAAKPGTEPEPTPEPWDGVLYCTSQKTYYTGTPDRPDFYWGIENYKVTFPSPDIQVGDIVLIEGNGGYTVPAFEVQHESVLEKGSINMNDSSGKRPFLISRVTMDFWFRVPNGTDTWHRQGKCSKEFQF